MPVAREGEEARGPADRKALGNDVAVAITGKLEHDIAASRHLIEQPARQARVVARYQCGEGRLRIGLAIVGACARIQ